MGKGTRARQDIVSLHINQKVVVSLSLVLTRLPCNRAICFSANQRTNQRKHGYSNGPEYINDNFPLIDKFEKCTVERVAGGRQQQPEQQHEQEQVVAHDIAGEPVASDMTETGGQEKGHVHHARPKLLRNAAANSPPTPLLPEGKGDAFASMISENGLIIGAALLVFVALFAALSDRRKNESKTQ